MRGGVENFTEGQASQRACKRVEGDRDMRANAWAETVTAAQQFVCCFSRGKKKDGKEKKGLLSLSLSLSLSREERNERGKKKERKYVSPA